VEAQTKGPTAMTLSQAQQSQNPISPRNRLCKGVSLDSFEIVSVLGSGSFGEVYLVKNKREGKYYAMKQISKKKIDDMGREN